MRASADDTILAIGRANAEPSVKQFEVVRQLSASDWDLALHRNTILSALNGPTTLGKVDKAFRSLEGYLNDAFASSGFQLQSWSNDEWALSLEQWLVQYVAVRRRFRLALREALGEDAAARAEEDFASAYAHNRDYRLVWELRNLSEHEHVVLDLVHRANGLGPDGAPMERWTLPLSPVLERMNREPARKALAALWEGTEAVPLEGYFERCMDALNRLVCAAWLRHQHDLIDAADAVLRMAGEVADNGEGAPVLMNLHMTDTGPTDMKLSLLLVDIAKHVRPMLADARRVMGASG